MPTDREAHPFEYSAWRAMIGRCHHPSNVAYEHYTKNGITVCIEWRESFSAFYEHIGPSPSKSHTVDRIEGTKGYIPGNVRWATRAEQARNRCDNVNVTIDGRTMCLKDWATELGLNYNTVCGRVFAGGWNPLDALSVPVKTARLYEWKGVSRTASEWSKIAGVDPQTIIRRAKLGMALDAQSRAV